MDTDVVLPESLSNGDSPAIKVVIIYEDFASGARGKNGLRDEGSATGLDHSERLTLPALRHF